MKYNIEIEGKKFDVDITSIEGDTASVTVNGKEIKATFTKEDGAAPVVRKISTVSSRPAAPKAAAVAAAPAAPAAPAAGAGKTVKAPLPGVILEVSVNVGDKVAVGDKLAVLEAMKMENVIESEFAGTVTAINVSKGKSVLEGEALINIA